MKIPRFYPVHEMEMKCPKCDFVASGENESAVKEELKEHMKSQHNMDEGGIESMLSGMKEKITGMFRR